MQVQGGAIAVASLALLLCFAGGVQARRILQQAYSGTFPASYGYYGGAASTYGSYGSYLPMGYQAMAPAAMPPAAEMSLPGRRKAQEMLMPYTAMPSTLGYNAYAMPASYGPAYGASAVSQRTGAYPAAYMASSYGASAASPMPAAYASAYAYGTPATSSGLTYVTRSANADGYAAGYYPSGSTAPAYAYGAAATAYSPGPYAPAYSAPSYMPETHSRKLFETSKPIVSTSSVVLAFDPRLAAYGASYSGLAPGYFYSSPSIHYAPVSSGGYTDLPDMPPHMRPYVPAYGSSSMAGPYGYGATTGAAYGTSYGATYGMPAGMAYGMSYGATYGMPVGKAYGASYSSAYGGYGGYAK